MLWRVAAYVAAGMGVLVLVTDVVLLIEHDQPLDARIHQILLSGSVVLTLCACTGRLLEFLRQQMDRQALDVMYLRGMQDGHQREVRDVAPMRRPTGR